MVDLPRVTFGIIVLNGEPFTRYCLRALYAFAHEIIVVEGKIALDRDFGFGYFYEVLLEDATITVD